MCGILAAVEGRDCGVAGRQAGGQAGRVRVRVRVRLGLEAGRQAGRPRTTKATRTVATRDKGRTEEGMETEGEVKRGQERPCGVCRQRVLERVPLTHTTRPMEPTYGALACETPKVSLSKRTLLLHTTFVLGPFRGR